MKTKLILCFALVLSGLSASIAQPGPEYVESLDAMVVKSPLIVRGYFSDDTRTHDTSLAYCYKHIFTIHVDEVLKGHPQNPVQVAFYLYDLQTNKWEQLIERHTPQLFFINTNDLATWQNIGLDTIQSPVTLMDSTTLTNPADILAYTRKMAKERITSTNTFWLGGGWYFLDVPVTPALEKRAKQLMQSNDCLSQAEGVRALGCFKSEKNVRLLKPLLNNSNYIDVKNTDRPWINQRVYESRKAAYDVLTNWDVNVSEPVWQENLLWHYDPAVRHEFNMEMTTNLSILSLPGNNIEAVSDVEWTNILVGSNMLIGTRCEWFVYPDNQPKPSKPLHIQQKYWPVASLNAADVFDRDNFPVAGQKYIIEADYTLFETDNPPADYDKWGELRIDTWRPQDGKNYRILVQRTLKTTFEP